MIEYLEAIFRISTIQNFIKKSTLPNFDISDARTVILAVVAENWKVLCDAQARGRVYFSARYCRGHVFMQFCVSTVSARDKLLSRDFPVRLFQLSRGPLTRHINRVTLLLFVSDSCTQYLHLSRRLKVNVYRHRAEDEPYRLVLGGHTTRRAVSVPYPCRIRVVPERNAAESQNDYLSDEMSAITGELTVRRPVYQQDELNHLCKYVKPKEAFFKSISSRCKRIEPLKALKNSIPLIGWLSAYNWKSDILGDLVAGITVAVMHIPQGMAYAILGNVPPIVGIYMAFFPVLVYLFLGTSRHNSMGTFALICMMTGKVVATYSSQEHFASNSTVAGNDLSSSTNHRYSPIEVATAVTFTVALIQLGMYVLRLGVIASLLADSLVSGFTTAAAIHVFTSQVKDLLGLRNLPKRKGPFKLILTYVDVLNDIDDVNGFAILLSCVTIVILVANNLLKPKVAKLSPFPIPIEMLAVVIGTTLSVYVDLEDAYGIVTVGHIPVGLPVPSMPPLSLVPNILLDSFVITMVSYTISMSMALIFAQKLNYEVDSNQELVAQGVGNLVGSFFSCMPFTASLSRSLIQQTVGGHTQLASLISCGILISVLLWIGPFFEPLPRCVLASVIVVALKGMLMKVTEFKKFWKLDRTDGVVWGVTFSTVVLLDVEYGLLIGIVLCIGKLILFSVNPYTCTLALVPGTELYLDINRYKGAVELPGIKIFHYSGSLNFACRQQFRDKVYKAAGLIPRRETSGSFRHDELREIKKLRTLILDFTGLSHIDPAGATTLGNLINEYCDIDIPVYVAGCSGPVYEMMRKCNLFEYKGGLFTVFPTIADAVHFARCNSEMSSAPWNSYGGTSIARL